MKINKKKLTIFIGCVLVYSYNKTNQTNYIKKRELNDKHIEKLRKEIKELNDKYINKINNNDVISTGIYMDPNNIELEKIYG